MAIKECAQCKRDITGRRGRFCECCKWKKNYHGNLYWQVVERDNYTCQECGKRHFPIKNYGINVHHINHNNKDNRMENLQVLCVGCHAKKRLFYCDNCKIEGTATSACQRYCSDCGVLNKKIVSYKNQIIFWIKKEDYKTAARCEKYQKKVINLFLARSAGYATDSAYTDKVISLIGKF
jgi:hypothetical protein